MLLSTTADRFASPIQVRRVAHQPCTRSRPGARPHAAYALTNAAPGRRPPSENGVLQNSRALQPSTPPSSPPTLSRTRNCGTRNSLRPQAATAAPEKPTVAVRRGLWARQHHPYQWTGANRKTTAVATTTRGHSSHLLKHQPLPMPPKYTALKTPTGTPTAHMCCCPSYIKPKRAPFCVPE